MGFSGFSDLCEIGLPRAELPFLHSGASGLKFSSEMSKLLQFKRPVKKYTPVQFHFSHLLLSLVLSAANYGVGIGEKAVLSLSLCSAHVYLIAMASFCQ